MLYGSVGIEKLCSHCPHIRTLGIHKELFQPVNGYHFRIIVEQQNILTLGVLHTQIAYGRKIKTSVILYDFYPVGIGFFNLLVICKGIAFFRIILHNYDLIIIICGLLQYGRDQAPQIINVILVGYDDRDKRILRDLVSYPEYGFESFGA